MTPDTGVPKEAIKSTDTAKGKKITSSKKMTRKKREAAPPQSDSDIKASEPTKSAKKKKKNNSAETTLSAPGSIKPGPKFNNRKMVQSRIVEDDNFMDMTAADD